MRRRATKRSSREARMNRRPDTITLNTTAVVVMLATSAAIALVMFAALTGVHLLPSALTARDIVHLTY